MVLLTNDEEVDVMKAYARMNGNEIDVYVKHDFEIDDAYARERNEGNGSNDVGDYSDELDDQDFVDSEYSMSDQDDKLFSENVDEDIERADSEEDYNASDSDDLESLPENDDVAEIEKQKNTDDPCGNDIYR